MNVPWDCCFLNESFLCPQVLFRLNFLVLVLCVVMNRPYQFYYFVPLVTFWFVVIYGMMAMWPQILQKTANGKNKRLTEMELIRFVCLSVF